MFKLIAGTEGNYRGITFQVSTMSRKSLHPLSSICSRFEQFRPVEHLVVRRRWNIPANKSRDSRWGIDICISCSDLPQFFNSYPNLGSFSNSLQSDLLSDLVYLVLKLPDLFRSESFRPFMLCFFYSIYQPLPWVGLFLTWSIILFVFWNFTGNHAYAVYKKRCHRLSRFGEKRCWDRTALSIPKEHGAR